MQRQKLQVIGKEFTQCHFWHILLVKQITVSAQIQGVEKKTPLLDGGNSKVIFQRGLVQRLEESVVIKQATTPVRKANFPVHRAGGHLIPDSVPMCQAFEKHVVQYYKYQIFHTVFK